MADTSDSSLETVLERIRTKTGACLFEVGTPNDVDHTWEVAGYYDGRQTRRGKTLLEAFLELEKVFVPAENASHLCSLSAGHPGDCKCEMSADEAVRKVEHEQSLIDSESAAGSPHSWTVPPPCRKPVSP